MNEKFLSELSARLAELAAANPARDLERNMRALLSSTFARLDLVTREEYDVQVQVLARAKSSQRSKRASRRSKRPASAPEPAAPCRDQCDSAIVGRSRLLLHGFKEPLSIDALHPTGFRVDRDPVAVPQHLRGALVVLAPDGAGSLADSDFRHVSGP